MIQPHKDQAAGLRRLMTGPRPRVISLLSAASKTEHARFMTNLAASLHRQGNKVLIMEATSTSMQEVKHYGIDENQGTLLEAVMRPELHQPLINHGSQGYSVAKLLSGSAAHRFLHHENTMRHIERIFSAMASQHDVILVDAALTIQDTMPLNILNHGEILIHMTRDASSITQAYSLIKQLCQQVGRRSFGIVVSHASESQARVIFNNIAEVARRHLYIELSFAGLIPSDEHLGIAAKLDRSVIDAFPMTRASAAFKALAGKIDHNHGLLETSLS
ncbi:MotR [Methylobacillus arboreus]|uniref:MinD/ParA family ATP-binding protein n=1 Tax=Methylobacillus arboreus TaxID=755170 RepID=UPI001E2E3641|nr:MotR [Methylobacillus arboreus]MCB5189293.1 MotR [Methylobacillus arboreus]